jgi:glycosyltransferase involved in cell wall biosynthesis
MKDNQRDRMTGQKQSIVHLITTIERGGAENQLLILSKYQISQGHEVKVYFLKGEPELRYDFEKNGVSVCNELANQKFVVQVLRLRRAQFRNSTIFHAHLPQAEILLKYGLAQEKHKCISRHYGGKFYPKAPNIFSLLLSRLVTWNIPILIAPSTSTIGYLYRSKEVSKKKKIHLASYGFSKDDFLKQKKHFPSHDINQSKVLTVGTVGRLSEEKDYPTILRAFAKVVEVRQDVSLKIVGSGPLESHLKMLTYALGITKSVEWLGKTNEISEFMSSLEVFVLASRFEGFGMVLLEAMASDLKIIASDAPTCLEVLGENGVASFFRRGDYEELAQQILNKLDESDHASAEREARLNHYKIQESGKAIEELYYSFTPNTGRIRLSQD